MLAEQAIVVQLAEHLPEVWAPVATAEGHFVVDVHGRVATVLPFLHGQPPDNRNPKHRREGADLLGRLHEMSRTLGLSIQHPQCPPVADLQWFDSDHWTWTNTKDYLTSVSVEETDGVDGGWMCAKLESAIAEIPAAVQNLTGKGMESLLIHGDFHSGNMVMATDHIVGLFDWDETRTEWRAWEVAQAISEFAVGPDHCLDHSAAMDFIATYETQSTPLAPQERDAIGLLMRAGMLWDVLYGFGDFQRSIDRQRGVPSDWTWAYQVGQIEAMDSLNDVRFR